MEASGIRPTSGRYDQHHSVGRERLHKHFIWASYAKRSTQALTTVIFVRPFSSVIAHGMCALEISTEVEKQRQQLVFAAGPGNWREDSRMLPLRHGLEPNDAALHSAFPVPTGELATFLQHTKAQHKHQLSQPAFRGKKNSSSGADATCGMIEKHHTVHSQRQRERR